MDNIFRKNDTGFHINDLFGKEVNILSDITASHTIKLGGIGSIKNLNRDIISIFEKSVGLLFLEKTEDGNVCFANNNEDLRDEFKQVFSPGDLLDYVYGILTVAKNSTDGLNNPEIPFPKDAEIFWRHVAIGRTTRLV